MTSPAFAGRVAREYAAAQLRDVVFDLVAVCGHLAGSPVAGCERCVMASAALEARARQVETSTEDVLHIVSRRQQRRAHLGEVPRSLCGVRLDPERAVGFSVPPPTCPECACRNRGTALQFIDMDNQLLHGVPVPTAADHSGLSGAAPSPLAHAAAYASAGKRTRATPAARAAAPPAAPDVGADTAAGDQLDLGHLEKTLDQVRAAHIGGEVHDETGHTWWECSCDPLYGPPGPGWIGTSEVGYEAHLAAVLAARLGAAAAAEQSSRHNDEQSSRP